MSKHYDKRRFENNMVTDAHFERLSIADGESCRESRGRVFLDHNERRRRHPLVRSSRVVNWRRKRIDFSPFANCYGECDSRSAC